MDRTETLQSLVEAIRQSREWHCKVEGLRKSAAKLIAADIHAKTKDCAIGATCIVNDFAHTGKKIRIKSIFLRQYGSEWQLIAKGDLLRKDDTPYLNGTGKRIWRTRRAAKEIANDRFLTPKEKRAERPTFDPGPLEALKDAD